MKVIIQKFGGTSVASEKRRELVIQKIIKAKEDGFAPVVVVSAMGRLGEPYATDTLISLAKSANGDLNKRENDMLMSCGEVISCAVMSSALKYRGLDCAMLTGGQAGIITDDNFGSASILRVEADNLSRLIGKGVIPVVAGFQGVTENGQVTTLGRGGSDTTAAVLGEALKAQEIQIYTDVDGIMTADPKVVPDAKVINSMGYNEVFQFADEGAKVIHPRAVEFAMRGNIPLVIKNTMSDSPGTLITSYYEEGKVKRLITGITYMRNRTQVCIEDGSSDSINDEEIFDDLAENNISIDLINVFPAYKAFTIDSECTEKADRILKNLNLRYRIIEKCSKVSIIGDGIRGVPGVMARVISTLKKNDIKILQTSDSHTTIWCLVEGNDTEKAVMSLHKEFNLSK